MTERLGKAGRFYSLTPKAHEFIKALEAWCDERGIDRDDIPLLLQGLSLSEKGNFHVENIYETLDSLIEKGYLEEKKGQ